MSLVLFVRMCCVREYNPGYVSVKYFIHTGQTMCTFPLALTYTLPHLLTLTVPIYYQGVLVWGNLLTSFTVGVTLELHYTETAPAEFSPYKPDIQLEVKSVTPQTCPP